MLPLGPIRATRSPDFIFRSTPRSTETSANDFLTESIVTTLFITKIQIMNLEYEKILKLKKSISLLDDPIKLNQPLWGLAHYQLSGILPQTKAV